MSNNNRLGANIRSLRHAYGETQPELGEAIGYEKNTISYYESGQREPDKQTLDAIAKHYMVSVEELLYSDLSGIGRINVDKDLLWKNIHIYLPIVSSEKALKNDSFNRAFSIHKTFYKQLHNLNYDGLDVFGDNCDSLLSDYLIAGEDDDIKPEASVNFVALWFLVMICLKSAPEALLIQPASLKQISRNDEKTKRIVDDSDSSFETESKDILKEFNDDNMKEIIAEMMVIIKRSPKWSDLADYYLALKYTFGIVDNDLAWGFNRRIGGEMMYSFSSVKNKYAARFIKLSLKSIDSSSSQFANDKA